MKWYENKWLTYTLLLTFYSIVYFVYSGQYPWFFGERLFDDMNGDAAQFVWNAHHFKDWMNGQQEYFYTNKVFAPVGTSLLFHTYCHLMSAFCYLIGDSYWGINIVIWLHYIFSGLGAYLVARQFKLNVFWAVIVGFIFAFAPYKFNQLSSHYNLQQTAFIPYFILVFFQLFPVQITTSIFSKFKIKKAVLLTIIGLLCALSCYIYAVFLFYFVLAYFLYYLIYKALPIPWHRIVLLIGLTVTASFLVPYLDQMGIDTKGAFWWRDDMGKFLTPNWNSLVYEWLLPEIYNIHGRLEIKHNDSFLGFMLPLLFVFGCVMILLKKVKKPTLQIIGFMSLFFFMLTSPQILVYKSQIGYMPTSFFHFIPVINNARIPERYIIMLALFFPILVFSFLQSLKQVKPKNILFPMLVLIIVAIEYYPKYLKITPRPQTPLWVNELKKLPEGNVLPLPTGFNDGNTAFGDFESSHLYYQTFHNQALVGGYISRITDELRKEFAKNKVLKGIAAMSHGQEAQSTYSEQEIENLINDYQIKYILTSKRDTQFVDFVETNFGRQFIKKEIVSEKKIIYVLR